MQSFLPYESFEDSAKVLDYRRLGKQRSETKQINKALRGESKGWRTHPAVLMWSGYEIHLVEYGLAMAMEWRRRGYRDATAPYFYNERLYWESIRPVRDVHWLGNPEFHASHRSNLLRKQHEYYSQFGWAEPNTLPYVWPTGFKENSDA